MTRVSLFQRLLLLLLPAAAAWCRFFLCVALPKTPLVDADADSDSVAVAADENPPANS